MMSVVADLERGLTREVTSTRILHWLQIRPKHGLGCWTAITRHRKGAREESVSTPELQDGAKRGETFTATID
jgi:hypothetical protein